MGETYKAVDVVIPCSDSLEELKESINSIAIQNQYINKVIIVFSGKNKNLLEKTGKEYFLEANICDNLFFFKDNKFTTTPGTARNKGLANCTAKYVGFLDCGMQANPEWISSFLKSKRYIRIGSTKYFPFSGFQTISALVTYGTKSAINSLPGTIIELSKCKSFNENTRIGEDLIWKLNYKEHWNFESKYPCVYSYFPKNLKSLIVKFYLLNIYALRVGGGQFKKVLFYTFSSLIVYLIAFLGFINNLSLFSFALTLSYLIIRFCYKNKYKYLFSRYIFVSIPLQFLFDFYKFMIVLKFFAKDLFFKKD